MKPNILFIFSDQQRWDTLGCYGQSLEISPNLDKMASEGIRFEHAFTCQPVCGPARACLQTGKYATEVGCYRNAVALPTDQNTIAKILSKNNYEVAYIGKWHLASTEGESNEDIGERFDHKVTAIPNELRGGYKDFWFASDVLEFTSHGYDGYMYKDMEKVDFKGYRADCQTDFVLDYLDNYNEEKPFFLFTSYIEPHHQNDHNCFEGPNGSKERYKDFKAPGDLLSQKGKGDWENSYPDYLGCCASLDKNVGRIREKLKEKGLDENTIIVYASDHGSHFKTRNGEYKRSCHESCIRVPLIIYGPGYKGGKVIDDLVSLIDLPSTILSFAGIQKPNDMQGNSLKQLVEGNNEDWQEAVFLQISESQVGRAIRTKRWKYSVYAPDKSGWMDSHSDVYVEQYLYDLDNDPYEQTNLVNDSNYKEIRKKLSEVLKQKMKEANEKVPEILPAIK